MESIKPVANSYSMSVTSSNHPPKQIAKEVETKNYPGIFRLTKEKIGC